MCHFKKRLLGISMNLYKTQLLFIIILNKIQYDNNQLKERNYHYLLIKKITGPGTERMISISANVKRRVFQVGLFALRTAAGTCEALAVFKHITTFETFTRLDI